MKKIKAIRINIIFIVIVAFVFLCLIYKLLFISTGHIVVNGKPLKEFASARHTTKNVIHASRGTIYSSGGEVLAKDVNSYTVIAYLNPSRTKDEKNPHHVVDKENTAEMLSPLINMKPETILALLNLTTNYCDEDGNCEEGPLYQVELGPGGRGITELVKDQIESLGLPGIDFIASTKRYYPNGDFASYSIGYSKTNDSGERHGEMGIELYYDEELTGEDGYIEYESDLAGYQITSTPSVERKAIAGNDVYLTLDTNIQMFTEQARATLEEGDPEWATVVVMDAKSGAILGVSSSPSFNNNTLEIKSYYDPFASYTYEPGSTFKIFSFMSAMEAGLYNGEETYKSGKITVDDAVIKDWNNYGWGTITYDEGFMGSSNVAATKLALSLGRAKLKDYYNALGFGDKTGITLPNEETGIVNFKYNTEIATASFGQGLTVTPVQMMQALTVLSNKGTMIKPYIVSKIVDNNNEVILENKRTEIRKVFSEETVNKMIELMRGVVDGSARMSTGTGYYIDGYDLVGKTGTAQIADSGGYMKGSTNYVRSFAGLFPGNDPQIIVYVAASKIDNSNLLKTCIKDLVKNVGTYLNIYGSSVNGETPTYEVPIFISKPTNESSSSINNAGLKAIVIGDGQKVINQYPKEKTVLNTNNKVFLLTSSNEYKMIDIEGWSRSDVQILCNLLNIKVTFEGFGYVEEYNIEEGTTIDSNTRLEVKLHSKYIEEIKEDE